MPSTPALPPGPPGGFSLRGFLRFTRDPLGSLTALTRTFGPVAGFRGVFGPVISLADPELIREVLVVKARSFEKDRGLRVAKRVLGEGLLTSEGEFHKRQRRLAQPAFHKQRIASYGTQMVASATRAQARWVPGQTRDIVPEMSAITLDVVARTLFGTAVDDEIAELSSALNVVLEQFDLTRLPLLPLLAKLPLPSTFRFRKALRRLDTTIHRFITERRSHDEDGGDLLSMLLLAQDTEGASGGMSDLQLRDEAMTLFLAGHETTAMMLSWTWGLLAQHPEAERTLHAELDAALAGRAPTVEDLPRLPYARQVITESMRLYPPAWILGRLAIEDVQIGPWTVPKGANVLMSQWVMHRDPAQFDQPLAFKPERWTPQLEARLPRLQYFPFGAGPRMCIGEQFAWMEGVLVLATLAQRWRFELAPGAQLTPEPRITLRPKGGIRMRLVERGPAPTSG